MLATGSGSATKCRNKMAIEKLFPNPTDVIFSGISLLQKWKMVLKEKESRKVDECAEAIIKHLKQARQVEVATDIMEI